MRFKIILKTFFAAIILTACNSSTIPDKQASLPEENVSQSEVTEKTLDLGSSGTNRYTEKHLEINKLIAEGKKKQALKVLEGIVFGPRSLEKRYYSSPEYGGFLDIYVTLVTNNSFSLDKFRNHFISPCIDLEQNICELISSASSMSAGVTNLIVSLGSQASDIVERIKILGLAYDTKSRRGSDRLDQLYLLTSIEMLNQVESGQLELSSKFVKKHSLNAQAIISQVVWSRPDEHKLSLFESIRPWEKSSKAGAAMDELRTQMVPYLPTYAERSAKVKASLKLIVNDKVEQIVVKGKDLKQYPAFDDIDLRIISEADTLVSYLALELFYRGITIADANAFVLKVSNRKVFMDRVLPVLKLLVRHDIAQLSVYSTEQLQKKFSEQDIKTNAFFQDTLEWSKALTPIWNEFHSGRGYAAKAFLEANARFSQNYDEFAVQEFFSAVNRNIMRTTVFPNMMAMSYYLAKTEWSATFKIWFFTVTIDTNELLDYLVTGQYENPWFNFTNLKEAKGWRLAEKTSLFRSEMFDALHYFLTTKTFEVYDIPVDDFLSLIGETVFKNRRAVYEKTLQNQKVLYEPDDTASGFVMKWCEGLRSGNPQAENIPFYRLSQHITPGHILTETSDHTRDKPYYFLDAYENVGLFERLHTTNDRYRLEFEPIMDTLNQYKVIVERAAAQYPQLKIKSLEKTKDSLLGYELLRMNYLGMQKAIAKKMGDCMYVAEAEAKRRAMAVGFAQYDYFSKIIHPLMVQVKSGEISLADANQVIQEAHGNAKGTFDRIEVTNAMDPIFVVSRLTYMLRTREMLVAGFDFKSDRTSPVSIDPIVGDHLKISVPSNFLNDIVNNRYISKDSGADDFFKIHFEEDASSFARSASIKTTDESRAIISQKRFTEWDQHDLAYYLDGDRYQLEYEITMLQIPEQKYMDVFKPGCWTTNISEINPDCIITEKADVKNVVDTMVDIIKAYEIDEEQREYLHLISRAGWADQDTLHTIVEFDPTTPYDWDTNSTPYQRLAGLMDMPYTMLSVDYLGIGFETRFQAFLMSGESRRADVSCQAQRSGCYWSNERDNAVEFFYARAKNPKMLFKFDTLILEEDFNKTKKLVMNKYQRLMDLEQQSSDLWKYAMKKGEFPSLIEINRFKKPQPLRALSPSFRNTQRDFDKFFREKTEGFFLEDHDWKNFKVY